MGKNEEDVVYIEGCPEWMMTMGDSMSLLLTFFVLLLTFSTPKEHQLMDVFSSIQGALGLVPPPEKVKNYTLYKHNQDKSVEGRIEEGNEKVISVSKENVAPVDLRSMNVINRFNEFKDRIQQLGFKNIVSSFQLKEGIVVVINMEVLFPSDGDVLSPQAGPFLESFANLAGSVGNELRLTSCFHVRLNDANPRLGGEWKKERNRVVDVAKFLTDKYDIDFNRFSFGEQVLTDTTPDRVELMIVDKLKINEVDVSELMKRNEGNL